MGLPLQLLDNIGFQFDDVDDLLVAHGIPKDGDEAEEARALFDLGLPPITSENALATMFGYNPGFIWSLFNQQSKHYRKFNIPKGKGNREIIAPRVGLKLIQKWISIHFEKKWQATACSHGFIRDRSHLSAAEKHLGARWVFSVDIENFFPSISRARVTNAIRDLGYITDKSIEIVSDLCCYNYALVQGAPSSPIVSNIVLKSLDLQLEFLANNHNIVITRYADDIVFSGKSDFPEELPNIVIGMITDDGWKISQKKTKLSKLPERLKVHGLLVHGDTIRLTKGYRNRIRAYQHLKSKGTIQDCDLAKINGHLNYALQIEKYES